MATKDEKKKIKAKKAKDESGGRKLVAQHKKARHDYLILDTYECGIVLTGTEVKSLRQGRASLVDGFGQLDGAEVWLHNVHIPEYTQGTWTNHAARRKRKLLLHRYEIERLIGKTQESGLTLVPLALYFLNGRAKVEIALAKGKKEYDKRQTLREKQDRRESDRAISAARRRQRAKA
ncbi:MAG: SsrA-binding protein SmpB [Streptomyces sp.]|uniref:SsrA-binding protein SmpB n=1 Tax=Streptomyces sp. TaxID=1931 RepID=UPI003D6C2FE0